MRHEDWDELRYFLAVVRHGSVRAAAAELKVSHSTVARRIESLANYAGGTIFHRRGNEVELSELGEVLLDAASELEGAHDALKRRIFGSKQELRGPVVLTMIDALAVEPVMGLIDEFCRRYPLIDLQLSVSNSLADLNRREADLALRAGAHPDESLIGRRVGRAARAVYIARSLWESLSEEAGSGHEGMHGLQWVGYSNVAEGEEWKKHTPFPDVVTNVCVPDMRAQILACEAGMGLIYVPCVMCDDNKNLMRLSEPDFPSYLELWLLRHKDSRKNAAVTSLSEFLYEGFRSISGKLAGNKDA